MIPLVFAVIKVEPDEVVKVPEPAMAIVAPKSIVDEAPTASVAFEPVVIVPAPLMVCVDEPLRFTVPAEAGEKLSVPATDKFPLIELAGVGVPVLLKFKVTPDPTVKFPLTINAVTEFAVADQAPLVDSKIK